MKTKLFVGPRPVTKQFAKSVRFAVGTVVEHLLYNKFVKSATKLLHPHYVVRATAVQKFKLNERQVTFSVTLGAPNYATTKLIKDFQKAKQNIPANRAQLKSWPVKRDPKPARAKRKKR